MATNKTRTVPPGYKELNSTEVKYIWKKHRDTHHLQYDYLGRPIISEKIKSIDVLCRIAKFPGDTNNWIDTPTDNTGWFIRQSDYDRIFEYHKVQPATKTKRKK